MSRCFPFPPPGYEKKARNNDAELLAKEKAEKHREENHKKKKKDKENGEGKEKKERSKDKHKEKKERKEKHRSKKKDKDREKDKTNTFDDRKDEGRSAVHDEEKHGESRLQGSVHMETKFAGELGKRFTDEATSTRHQVFGHFTSPVQRSMDSMFSAPNQRRVESHDRAVEKDGEKRTQRREKKEGDDKRAKRERGKVEGRITRHEMGQNDIGTEQGTREMVDQKKIQAKDRNKDKKSREGDAKRGDRHRETDQEHKKGKRKDKERDKEKGNEKEKVKKKAEIRHKELDKLCESQRAQIYTLNIKPQIPLKDSEEEEKSINFEGNLKKRKDFEPNGFIHENNLRPNKLSRPASCHIILENGRKLEPSLVSNRCTPDREGETNTGNGDTNKEQHKVNGTIEAQPSVVLSRPQAALETRAKASTKPPHPDSIYLNQLLSIPKMVEWSDSDDQEWLFNSDGLHLNPKAASLATETSQVWAEVRRIESVDVCALPYVIPY